jgi:hypothetical protein
MRAPGVCYLRNMKPQLHTVDITRRDTKWESYLVSCQTCDFIAKAQSKADAERVKNYHIEERLGKGDDKS